MKSIRILSMIILLAASHQVAAQGFTIDHSCTDIHRIPASAIQQARSTLHIAYGHTSHGSQLITGMTALVPFMNTKADDTFPDNAFTFNNGGTGGALDLRDTPFSGANDLGAPNRTAWATATRNYLAAHPEVNVIIWSWCGQVDGSESDINTYLNLMSQLEVDYPNVKFVYMTGHLNGTGAAGNVNVRNNQIRAYCAANNKILYDFADIESYDPDRLVNYMALLANDNCDYDSDGNGSLDRNWAIAWQNTHTQGVDWFDCYPAHSQALNGNLKAYAAWWLWARLAGWDGPAPVLAPIGAQTVAEGERLSLHLSATDSNDDPLTFSITGLPDGATWDAATAAFAWTPAYTQAGNYQVTFDVSDGTYTDSETVTITVGEAPQPVADARYVRCEVPTDILTDQVFEARIYLTNIGSAVWGSDSGETRVTLVSKNQDFNSTWGTYFIIQGQHHDVAPDETFAFTSFLKAPSTPGDYAFTWQAQNWIPVTGNIPTNLTTIPFIGDLIDGPTIHVTQRQETPPEPPPHVAGQLDISDFEYVGSFRLPGIPKEEDIYNDSGIALRTVDGVRRMFVSTGTLTSRVYEVTIPELIPITNGDYSAILTAPFAQDWGPMTIGVISQKLVTANCGFWYDHEDSTLYWSHSESYYAGEPNRFPQLMATRLNADGTTTHLGAWNIPPGTDTYKGYWGGVTKLPDDFAATYTGGRDLAVGFGGYYSVCGTASRGPALAAIARPNASQTNLNLLPMMIYPERNAACVRDGNYFSNIDYWNDQPENPWTGLWTGVDRSRAGVFINLPDKKGYVVFANQGTGRLGYDYGGYNADGHYQHCWYFYDIADLGAAARGDRAANSLQPETFAKVQLPYDGKLVTGACFDEETRRLYLYVRNSLPNGKPLIHAYRVTPTLATNYTSWKVNFFWSHPGVDDLPQADPDGDGVSNFSEYALNGHPLQPGSSGTAELRTPQGAVEFVYDRRITNGNGLTYRIETCTNLIEAVWTEEDVTEIAADPVNDDFERVTCQISSSGDSEKFIRLIVE